MTEVLDPSLSRNDLIVWINDMLKLNITRIEQLGTGAVHCQILDVIYPGRVPLQKVNWRAKFEYEFVYNFKILQQSFTKFNIPKYIDVEKLIKAKYQDNLEFAQWMKRYFQANCNNWKDYDPVSRRGNIEPDFNFVDKAAKGSTTKDQMQPASITKSTPSMIFKTQKTMPLPNFSSGKPVLASKNDSLNISKQTMSSSSNSGSTTNLFANVNNKENEIMQDLNNILEKQKYDRNPQLEILKAERDFYYGKLKDIDHILDVYKDSNAQTLINNIRDIIYMVPEKIAIVCEDGNVRIRNKNESTQEDELMLTEGNQAAADLQKNEMAKSTEEMIIEDDLIIINNA